MRLKQTGIVFLLGLIVFITDSGFSFSEEIRYQAGGRRDPFIPINTIMVVTATEQEVNIEGIIYDRNGASVVVVKGDAYHVGEMIGDLKISKIYSSHVTMENKDGVQQDYWISESAEQLLAR